MSVNERFSFSINNHDPESESCFNFKSKFINENTVETALEFYGSYDNIVTTFIALYNDNEQARELLSAVMAGLTMNRIHQGLNEGLNDIHDQDGQDEKNNENEADGDSLSA